MGDCLLMSYRKLLLCVLGLLLFWGMPVAAAVLQVTPGLERQAIHNQLEYLVDPSGALTIQQILQHEPVVPVWRTHADGTPNFGFTRSAYWFHFRLQNTAATTLTRFLEISYALLDSVELFVVQPGLPPATARAGNAEPFAARPIPHRHLVFTLDLQPGVVTDVYLRVKSGNGMQVPMQLWEERAFWHQDQYGIAWQFLYYGLMIVMVFYNLFLAWGVRDKTYLYYVLMVANVCVFQMILHGSAYQFLWPEFADWNALAIGVFIPVSNACSSLFAEKMLQVREYFPRYFAILRLQVWLAPLLVLATLIFPFEIVVPVSTALVLLTAAVVGFASIQRWPAGGLDARYFAIAWNMFVVGCLTMSLNKFGVLPYNWFTENLMQIGSGVETILMSLALAARINGLREAGLALERQQLDARQQAMQAEASLLEAKYESKAKSDFLAVMSHEIRTPMNGVLGVLELLRDTPLTPKQNELVGTIQSSGKMLLNIINDILDFSKIEAGKMELERIRFSLRQVLRDALQIHKVSAAQKGLLLACHVDPELDDALLGDPSRLKQVIYNLLGNAIKFTAQGHVFVRVKVLSQTAQAQQISLEIMDSGIGMSAEQQQRLFNPFTQADTSTSRKYGGTGLGLAISKRLIEAMGGSIGVDSLLQRGSCFWFQLDLPLVRPRAVQMPARVPQRLLLCSNYLPLQEFLETSLNKQCFAMHSLVLQAPQLTAEDVQAAEECGPSDSSSNSDSALVYLQQAGQQPVLLVGAFAAVRQQLPLTAETLAVLPALDGCTLQTLPFDLNQLPGLRRDAETAPEETPAAVPRNGHAPAQLHVLVAEDNAVNQMVIRELLRPLVGEIDLVGNGREALERSRNASKPYDLIFMDCEMPEMDGYEATLRIREYERRMGLAKGVTVVALTAHAFDEYRQKAFAVGMSSHLTKPVTRARLQQFFEEEFGHLRRTF